MLMLRHMHMTHFGHHVIIVVWQETWNGRIWFLPLADFYCSTQKTTRLPPRKDKNCGSNGNPFLSDTKVGHTALVHFLKTLKREFSACVVNAKQNAAMWRACCPFRSFHNSLAIYTIYIYILYIYVYVIVLIAIARRTTKQISMPVWRLDLVSALQDLQSYGFAQHVRSIIA